MAPVTVDALSEHGLAGFVGQGNYQGAPYCRKGGK